MTKLLRVLALWVLFSQPAFAQIPIDVFGTSGQSNSVGNSGPTGYQLSPQVVSVIPGQPGASVYAFQPSTGLFVVANDPVANANTGSMWPSFGGAYYGQTGRRVLLVLGGVNSASQSSIADYGVGNWDVSGTLVNNLVAQVNSAMAIATASGFTPTFRGIIHGPEGETDGFQLVNLASTYSIAQYRAALINMIARFRTAFGNPTLPIFQIRVGGAHGTQYGSFEPSFVNIRAEQEYVASIDPNAPIVYRGGTTLFARGLSPDGLHFHQIGYNEMGAVAAATIVASGLVPAITAPAGF